MKWTFRASRSSFLAVRLYQCGLISITPWRNRNTKEAPRSKWGRGGRPDVPKITQRSGGRTLRFVVSQLLSLANYANTTRQNYSTTAY
jgi:hypothetical protein